MKKVLIGVVGLLAVAVVVLLVGPGFFDWNRYKPWIAEMAEAATGRRLSIDGDISLAILPKPTLSVHALRLANLPGAAAPDMLRLETLDVQIALLPLLFGNIQVQGVTLIEPEVELEVLADGRRNWDFAPARADADVPPTAGATPPESAGDESSGPGSAAQSLRFDRIHIENGSLGYVDLRTGRSDRLERLDADISVDSMAGPFRAEGRFVYRGLPLAVVARFGRLDGGRATIGLEVTADGAQVKLSRGSVALDDDGLRFSGRLQADGDDLKRLVDAALAGSGRPPELPGWLAQRFSLEAVLDGSAGALTLNEIAAALGETRITGAVDLGFAKGTRVDAAFSVKKIDLDKWLSRPAAAEPDSTPDRAEATDETKPAARAATVAVAATADRGVAIPADLTGSLDLSIDAIVYRGAVVQKVHLAAKVKDGVVTISKASAALPGGSQVTAGGRLDGSGERLAFQGQVAGESRNARAVLEWLEVPLDELPAGRLRGVDFKGKVSATRDQLRVTDFRLAFDSSILTGAATVALRQRPAFGLRLDLDRLDLDAYLPPRRAAAKPADNQADAATKAKPTNQGAPAGSGEAQPGVGNPLAALQLLDRFDANITASIGVLTVNRQPIKGIRFDGQILDGALVVRKAEIEDLAGGKGVIKGSLRDLGTTPAIDLQFELAARDAAKVLKVAGITPPAAVAKAGALRLKGSAKGTAAQLKVDAAMDAFAGRLTFDGTLASLNADPGWDLRVDARFPELRPVLAALGIAVPRRKLGAFALDGVTKGSLAQTTIDAEVTTGAGKMTVKGAVTDLLEPLPGLDLAVDARGLQPQFLAAFLSQGPGRSYLAGLSGLNAQARAKIADGNLDVTLESVEALGFGGKATVAGRIEGTIEAPRWSLRLDAGYPELTPVLAALGVAAPGAGGKLGAFTVTGTSEGNAEALRLDTKIGTGGGVMTVAGRVGDPFGEQRSVDLSIDSAGLQPQFLAAFAPNPTVGGLLGGLTEINGKLVAKGPVQALTVTLDGVKATGFNGSAKINGEITDLAGKHPKVALDVGIRDVDAVRLAAVFGVRYRPRARALPLTLAGRITGALGRQIEATGLNGQIGAIDNAGRFFPTTINGTMRASLAGPRPKYTVNLNFGDIFVDHYLAREQRQGALPRDYQLMPGIIRAAAQTIQPPAAARRIPWTREPISVAALREIDADIALNGNGLTYGKIQIHRPRATLALANGVLRVSEFGGGFTEGGTISGTGSVDVRDVIALAANVAINNADVHRALSWFAKIDRAAGRMSITGTFQARGRSQAELVSSLSGRAKLSGHIRPGKQTDAGFAQLIACTGLTSKLGGVLGDLAKDVGPLGGAGVFGEYMDLATVVLTSGVGDVSGDIQIDNGLVWSRNIQVISRQGGGRAFIAGDVALPQYTVYGQIELLTPESDKYSQQVGRREPYLVAEYAADLDGNDKRTKLDGLFNDGNFKQTNCQGGPLGGVLGGAGGGKLGEMLGTVLGREPATAQPQPDQQPAQQPATPQDQLKDLLGGLGDLLKKQ